MKIHVGFAYCQFCNVIFVFVAIYSEGEYFIGVNLRNDVIFKVVFGHQKNEKILISLLNAILDLKGQEKIKKLVLTNPINLKEFIEDKLSKLDVKSRRRKRQII